MRTWESDNPVKALGMATDKLPTSRKKPVSQKRVAIVLACLVGALTVMCGLLILMEDRPLSGSSLTLFTTGQQDWSLVSNPHATLQTGRWNYIIIYESADSAGRAANLADGRAKAGGWPETNNSARQPANFHFVVDTVGSRTGAIDGELEIGSAWLNQISGAPYAGWPDSRYHNYAEYRNAVGICLIGDINRTPISEPQSQTLLQLTTELQHRLHIPSQQVLFQWELVPNAARATPAQRAFAVRFRQMLD